MMTPHSAVKPRRKSKLGSISFGVQPAVLAAACFLVSGLHVSALSFSIVEDSPKRLAFDLVWGPNFNAPSSFHYLGGPIGEYSFRYVSGGESHSTIGFQAAYSPLHDLFPDPVQVVDFSLGLYSDRRFELLDVVQPAAVVQVLPLDPTSNDSTYGARFVYGTPYPSAPPINAPEGGSSAVLMALGLVGLSLARAGVLRG